jgi:hypothetical protein
MSTEAERFAPTRGRGDPGAARHRDLPDRGVGQRPHQPDQRAPGHDRAQRASQPGPGAAGQRERDPLQQAPQLRRATLMPPGQPGQLLSKGRHRARRGIAPHPPDRQLDLDRPAAAGQIPQAAPVPIMNPRRRRPAARAGQQPCARAGRDPHPVTGVLHLAEVQARQMQEQHVEQMDFPLRSAGAAQSAMRMILGLDAQTSEIVTVNGRVYAQLETPPHEVGTPLETRAVHTSRSARNHLRAMAATTGISRGRVEEVIDLVASADASQASRQPRPARSSHPAEVNTSGRPPLVLTSQPQAECLVRRDARHRYQNGRRVACLL